MKEKPSINTTRADIPLLTQVAARTDIASALAIEIAIALRHLLGMKIAAQFLKNHKIGIDIALRVLLQPYQRRQYSS